MSNIFIPVFNSPHKFNTQIKQKYVSEEQIEDKFQENQNSLIQNENFNLCDQNESNNVKNFIFLNDQINQKQHLNKRQTYSENKKPKLKEIKYRYNIQRNKCVFILTLLFIIFLVLMAKVVLFICFEYNFKGSDQSMNFRTNGKVSFQNTYKKNYQNILNKQQLAFDSTQIDHERNENYVTVKNQNLTKETSQNSQINLNKEIVAPNLKQIAQIQSLQNPVIQNISLQNFINNQKSSIPLNNAPIQQKKIQLIKVIPNSQQFIEKDENQEIDFASMKCDQYLANQQHKYGKLFTFNCPNQIFRINSNVDHFSQSNTLSITSVQFAQAVDLLDIIHHIDQSGKVVAKNTPCQTAQNTIKRLNETLQKQFQRLDNAYQISKYHQHQLRFCIVSNSYRNAQNGLMYRNIDSIIQQNYSNYHVVYTDDASPDLTRQIVKQYLSNRSISDGKFKVKINSEKKGMMENIYQAVTDDCQAGQIVVMLDGDDSFIGVNVLSFLNAVYQKQKLAMMWNNFIQINSNQRSAMGFSRQYHETQQINGGRRTLRFVSSHLKSFYVDIFRKIKVSDLQYSDGKFFGGASDTAMMYAMIEMSSPRFKYVPEIMYEYRTDTGQLGMVANRQPQQRALTKIQSNELYKPLDEFQFINQAIQRLN